MYQVKSKRQTADNRLMILICLISFKIVEIS